MGPFKDLFFGSLVILSLVFISPGHAVAEQQDKGFQECVEKGNKLRDQERYREALKTWDECLRLDPANSMLNSLIMITKGQMVQEEDRYTRIGTKFYYSEPGKALQAWRKVVSINPQNQEASENARRLEEEIDAQLSKPLVEAELALKNKEFLHAQEYVADALRLDPRHPKALELMKQIKVAYMGELKGRAVRAEQYYRAGNHARAVRMFEDLVSDKSYPPEELSRTYTYLGLSYASLDDEQNALESFRNALRFNQAAELPQDTPERIRSLFHKAKNGG
jgi:tetratricopeptide (TPR) repeat protein